MQQTDPAPGLPSRLVIDAQEPLAAFKAALEKLENLQIELKVALGDVIECLQHQEDAAYELSHSGYEMAPASALCLAGLEPTDPQPVISQDDQEAFDYIEAREKLGLALLKLFNDFKLFKHGKLFYQIHEVLGTALVMDKIGVPFLAEDRAHQRYVNNIDRHVTARLGLPARWHCPADVPQRTAKLFDGLSPEDQIRFRAFATSLGRP